MLRSGDARLSRQPREWLASLFERTTRPEQDVRDLIRRSAGIPFGFMAVFLAEPRGVPRTLLHEALEKLLDLAVRGLFFFVARVSLAVVFRHSSKLVLLSSRRTKTAAVTKTRLPLLMISEDDRRLNRTNKHPGQDRAVVARKRGSHARKRARFSVFVSFFLVVGSDGSVSAKKRANEPNCVFCLLTKRREFNTQKCPKTLERRRRVRPPRRGGSRCEPGRARSPGARV